MASEEFPSSSVPAITSLPKATSIPTLQTVGPAVVVPIEAGSLPTVLSPDFRPESLSAVEKIETILLSIEEHSRKIRERKLFLVNQERNRLYLVAHHQQQQQQKRKQNEPQENRRRLSASTSRDNPSHRLLPDLNRQPAAVPSRAQRAREADMVIANMSQPHDLQRDASSYAIPQDLFTGPAVRYSNDPDLPPWRMCAEKLMALEGFTLVQLARLDRQVDVLREKYQVELDRERERARARAA